MKRKNFWENGGKFWIWFLLISAFVGLIAKAAVMITDTKRYEPRIQVLEEYKEEDEKNTVKIQSDIEHIKESVDKIDRKLDRALRR